MTNGPDSAIVGGYDTNTDAGDTANASRDDDIIHAQYNQRVVAGATGCHR